LNDEEKESEDSQNVKNNRLIFFIKGLKFLETRKNLQKPVNLLEYFKISTPFVIFILFQDT